MNDMRVGIMGGTFDPIHIGHLVIAQNAYEEFKLDKVLFIPSGNSYMKSKVSDSSIRLEMTSLAINDDSRFEISDIETIREGNSYSYETIELLKKQNPHTDYFFIVGTDTLMSMDKWRYPEKIFNEVTVLVAFRKGNSTTEIEERIRDLEKKYPKANIQVLPVNYVDFSSTEIRRKVKEGKSIKYLVSDAVYKFICENELYKNEGQNNGN